MTKEQQIEQQIEQILFTRYNNYSGQKYKTLRKAHAFLQKKLGNESFLKHLQDCEIANPKPAYNEKPD